MIATDDTVFFYDDRQSARRRLEALDAALDAARIPRATEKDVDHVDRLTALGCEITMVPPLTSLSAWSSAQSSLCACRPQSCSETPATFMSCPDGLKKHCATDGSKPDISPFNLLTTELRTMNLSSMRSNARAHAPCLPSL